MAEEVDNANLNARAKMPSPTVQEHLQMKLQVQERKNAVYNDHASKYEDHVDDLNALEDHIDIAYYG